MFEFLLDFTKSVPFRYCPTTQEAQVLYIQCIAQAPMDIEFRPLKTGIFMITVGNEKDKKRLEGQFLTHDYGEKPHILHSAKVPLLLQKKRHFYENPKWITIDKLYDSGLKYASNEQVDAFLTKYGDLITPTHEETDRYYGFRTGKKKAQINITTDIERWQEIELQVNIDNKSVKTKGRVNIFYRGQPYMCRDCNATHTEKCPQRIAKEAVEAEVEKTRLQRTNTLFIGDSNLRRVNEKGFFFKSDCASGAKIGHVANSLHFTKEDEYNNVIVHVGQNNIDTDPQVNMKIWETQVKKEVTSLRTKLTKFKKAVVVGVPPAPICNKSEKTKTMRTKVNEALKGMTAGSNNKIRFVGIEHEDNDTDTEVGGSNWEDPLHMTEKFTHHMLGKVAEKMLDIQGGPLYVANTSWTCARIHSGVKNTYKFGCELCTIIGHAKEACSTVPSEPGKTKNKRGPPSGSDEPSSKKAPNV